MTSRFPPFAFVELVSPYNKKNITRWLEDMNFMFSWQEQYLTRSLRSLVRYYSCHSNIKFISSRQRVISSIYFISSGDHFIILQHQKVTSFNLSLVQWVRFEKKKLPLSVSWYTKIGFSNGRVDIHYGLFTTNVRGLKS